MGKRIELKKGDKLHMLTYIQDVKLNNNKRRLVSCLCDCGNVKTIELVNIIRGHTKSCGCFRKQTTSINSTTHGLSKTNLHRIYHGMLSRCYNKKSSKYKFYGLRGITVCKEWLNSEKSFYDWAIYNGWKKGLSIDRKNTFGNYEPDNCRFVNQTIQNRNSRSNINITYKGVTMCASEWSRLIDFSRNTIVKRFKKGWDHNKIIETPLKK